jgi:hypothetical protein
MNPWTFEAKKRGKNGGEQIIFYFQGKEYMEQGWYPPWQNELQRANAKQI